MNAKLVAIIVLCLALLGPAVAAEKAGPHGFIYGTVELDNGRSYKGLLRWGTEETFWDDLFNSTKKDLPYLEEHARDERRRNRIKVFGITVGYRWDDAVGRMFIARFGDIEKIVVLRGEKIEVTMKGGALFAMNGGSNDIGAVITVWDDALGEVKIDWDDIEEIRFQSTPKDIKPPAYRLYGEVETDDRTFVGYVQWDVQECLSIDKLDGESDDGKLSVEMGKIRAIEKNNRRGSKIELKDGREFVMEGSNDVDSSLRGIWVEDARYGRVKIPWKAWKRVVFEEVDHSGRGYDDYPTAGPLHGKVTDYDGKSHAGDLIFDLDEAAGWELLNGDLDEVEYHIPFDRIRSIEPEKDDASRVVLKNGETLMLRDRQDVAERNDGIVVLRDNQREFYLGWDEVKKIEFE